MGATPTERLSGDDPRMESADRPSLVYRDDRRRQHVLSLSDERLTVGRDPSQDLSLEWDSEVSRLHALLERLGATWTVVDDQISSNGTFVNGVRVSGRRRLRDQDVIRFGATLVTFRDPAAPTQGTAPSGGWTSAAPVGAAQRRVLVALCRPLLAGSGVAVVPSNREIADELSISIETVRSQMKLLFEVLGVPELPPNRKRAELAQRAIAAGIVRASEPE
jgi:pSer/pThr/pTyr-binding forkhead associated (FHA) protein